MPAIPSADIARHVRAVDGRTWEIDQRFVDRLFAEQAGLLRSVPVALFPKDGHVTGVVLEDVRPGSLPEALGFQSGDIVRAIDHYSLADPAGALTAYAHLRDPVVHGILFERDGRSLLHAIRVVPDR